ncbi:MAG: Rrf2 family transcriptional regulator [Verrucomicrobiales bacterium]
MKLSKRGEYGMRTLINLGIAREVGRDVVAASDLANVDNLPLKFVEQILADFRHAGIVGTKRGKFGGYFLQKPANEIKMGDMVRLLDGMLAPIPCASEAFYQPCTCADEDHCGLRMLMIDVRNAISNILDRYTLGDVVEVTLRKLRRDKLPIPFAPVLTPNPTTSPGEAPRRHADPEGGFLAILKEIPAKRAGASKKTDKAKIAK